MDNEEHQTTGCHTCERNWLLVGAGLWMLTFCVATWIWWSY